jgi:hypothetical protein
LYESRRSEEMRVAEDTVREEIGLEVGALMDRIARGQPVARTELVSQLERMFGHVARMDADFNCVALLVRRRTSLVFTTLDVLDVDTLRDGTAIIYTAWTVATRASIMQTIRDEFPEWLTEHGDLRGVPMFSSSQMELVRTAVSYEDALFLLGDDATFLR